MALEQGNQSRCNNLSQRTPTGQSSQHIKKRREEIPPMIYWKCIKRSHADSLCGPDACYTGKYIFIGGCLGATEDLAGLSKCVILPSGCLFQMSL